MGKLLSVLGFGWRRTSDASVLAWLFPATWLKIVTALAAFAAFVGSVLGHAPPWAWIPLALLGALLALATASVARFLLSKVTVPKPSIEPQGNIGLYIASAENVFHNVSASGFDNGVVLDSGARGNVFSGLQLDRGPIRHSYIEPLKWAHDYLAEQVNVAPRGDPKIWDSLRAAARAGEIIIWGRPGVNGLSPDQYYKPPEAIPPGHWRDFGFDHMRCIFHDDERECGTEPDESNSLRHNEKYGDLRVSEGEIRARWPS